MRPVPGERPGYERESGVAQAFSHIAKLRMERRSGGLRIDEPGTYRYWCSVTGHRSAGMKGTIVVQ